MNIQAVSITDPYLYQALCALIGSPVAVETVKGSLRGDLQKVLPDHIVIEVSGCPFHVRMQQIVWIYPG